MLADLEYLKYAPHSRNPVSARSRSLYRSEPRAGKSELLTMSPIEFLRRWGLLMPPPHKNLIHYYGAGLI